MKIRIDDREDPKRRNIIKKAYPDICSVERLDTADIVIECDDKPSIAIEVKTIDDFINSIKNRMLRKELITMREKYDYCCCFIYGDWHNDTLSRKYSNATVSQKYSAIIEAIFRINVPVIYGAIPYHLIIAIDKLIQTIDKKTEPLEKPIIRHKNSNPFVNVLIGINGVGEKTALRLLDNFKNPAGVFNASREDLESIKPRLRKNIIDEIIRMGDDNLYSDEEFYEEC